jgi:hypothetical protein
VTSSEPNRPETTSTEPTSTEPTSAPETGGLPSAQRTSARRLRRAATGVTLAMLAVGAGGVAASMPPDPAPQDHAAAVLQAASSSDVENSEELGADAVTTALNRRVESASRSADRVVERRAAKLRAERAAKARAARAAAERREALRSADPRAVARAMLPQFGFGADQFSCLDALWEKESGWDPRAANPTSSAYGIPQALPGSKMASAGADWADNPATQIRWGLGYIQGRYGSPCSAWSHSQANNWY